MLNFNFSKFYFIEKPEDEKKDIIEIHTLTDYPKKLQKKITLLQHFRSYLEADKKGKPKDAPNESYKDGEPIYVKNWLRTRHAIMFRMSNKIIQANFEDHTQIVLNAKTREVYYTNKKGINSMHPLSTVMDSSNSEMIKRLKYTKDILAHMLTVNKNKSEMRMLIFIIRKYRYRR